MQTRTTKIRLLAMPVYEHFDNSSTLTQKKSPLYSGGATLLGHYLEGQKLQ
jgi:hypothetical protein